MGADVEFMPDMLLRMKKKQFLANPKNKQRFINLLGSEMEKSGIQVRQALGDADYDIVTTACNVVGDHTDLLVLLQHHFTPSSHENIYLKTSTILVDISILQKGIDPTLGSSLLFIHAMSGCDTTSRPYGIGKVSTMGKYKELKDFSEVFMKPGQNQKDIEKSGNQPSTVLQLL